MVPTLSQERHSGLGRDGDGRTWFYRPMGSVGVDPTKNLNLRSRRSPTCEKRRCSQSCLLHPRCYFSYLGRHLLVTASLQNDNRPPDPSRTSTVPVLGTDEYFLLPLHWTPTFEGLRPVRNPTTEPRGLSRKDGNVGGPEDWVLGYEIVSSERRCPSYQTPLTPEPR